MPQLEINNVVLHYQIDGAEGLPWLVLSNSLGTNLEMWAPQMPSLLEHFRVLRYDTRGHGKSGVPPGPYSIAQLGGDVLALLDHVGIARAHFCGLSMGGLTGIWLGINYPSRLNRLVLCNTAARIGTNEIWEARIEAVTKGGMTALSTTVVDRWFTRDFMLRVPAKADLVRSMLLSTQPAGYLACCATLRDTDLRDSLSGITVPTLVISGMRDKATSPQEGKLIAERVRSAKYVELKAAHLSNWEVPQTFVTKVIGFLQQ